METIQSFRNPFKKIDDKLCESCKYGNLVGWPLVKVFVQDENKEIWLCENCLDKAKKDSMPNENAWDEGFGKSLDKAKEEANVLENRDNFENPKE